MNTLTTEQVKLPAITSVKFSKDIMIVGLSDGRTLSIPIAWYPRLVKATGKQLKNFEISPGGYGIHWPDVDEDLSVRGFLFP
ncbi:MAG: DUF2442 domain-containing protein [Endomicrobiia bacterium]|nr:DUF2442 domain-containing protein [Endomicrobiia bacterium]